FDDTHFLRALSLVALGWNDLAVPSFLAVLEADPPGPYYVPALLELIEIHDRAGRWNAVAHAWRRYVDQPLRSGGSRSERIGEVLFEFGTLRSPIPGSSRREKSLLSKPKELAVILEKRRERPSDRLLYRSGLALLRLGRHEESLRALLMIGIESPYYPYARYSIAQDLFALGQGRDAIRTLIRLGRYPKITQEERALGSRAQVLHAAIRFRSGEVERGIGIARSIAHDDPEAPGARLLITTALVDAGEPALALAYDTARVPPIAEAEAGPEKWSESPRWGVNSPPSPPRLSARTVECRRVRTRARR
ncbi:MAG: tetratricopeptide repeat protein, partial [Candidatus Binatia bacterium]